VLHVVDLLVAGALGVFEEVGHLGVVLELEVRLGKVGLSLGLHGQHLLLPLAGLLLGGRLFALMLQTLLLNLRLVNKGGQVA